MKELLSVKEIAAYLGVKNSWVYEQVRLKKMPFYKIGKYLRFSSEDISNYLAEKSTKAKIDELH